MGDDANIYDLGEIDTPRRHGRTVVATAPRDVADGRPGLRATRRPCRAVGRPERNWPIGFALFLPGSGHIVKGEYDRGLFVLSTLGFLVSFAWAVLATLERLDPNLVALGLPAEISVWTLGALFLAIAGVHV